MSSEISVQNLPPTTTPNAPGSSGTPNPNELGQDTFLKLLITQIQNQNPLDPSNPTEFLGQLASFSSLEQMGNIHEGIESLAALQATGLTLQNINLVGKTAVFEGTTAPAQENQAHFRFRTTVSAERVVVEYSDGGVPRSMELRGVSQGVHDLRIDDVNGQKVELLRISAYNGDDRIDTTITTFAVGRVDGLTFESGAPMLMVGPAARVAPAEVIEILE